MKLQFCIQCSFSRHVGPLITYSISYFCSSQKVVNNTTNLEKLISELITFFDNSIQNYEGNGSGWTLVDIDRLDVQVSLYLPIKAGSNCSITSRELYPQIFISILNT